MALDRRQIEHVAGLARLGLEEGDVEFYELHLNRILEHFAIISSVDTTAVEPITSAAELRAQTRVDQVKAGLSPDQALAAAPARDGDRFVVEAIQDQP